MDIYQHCAACENALDVVEERWNIAYVDFGLVYEMKWSAQILCKKLNRKIAIMKAQQKWWKARQLKGTLKSTVMWHNYLEQRLQAVGKTLNLAKDDCINAGEGCNNCILL
jgi:hypothetical protein